MLYNSFKLFRLIYYLPVFSPLSAKFHTSQLTHVNHSILSIFLTTHQFTVNTLQRLSDYITTIPATTLNTACILITNSTTSQNIVDNLTPDTDRVTIRKCIKQIGESSIPIITCFTGHVSGIILEISLASDIRVWHSSSWIGPMMKDVCIRGNLKQKQKSLRIDGLESDPRVDRRSLAYKMYNKELKFSGKECVEIGLGDICVPFNGNVYLTSLQLAKGIIEGINKFNMKISFI